MGVCLIEHDGNYDNPSMRTLDYQPDIDLTVLLIITEGTVNSLCAEFKTDYRVKELQNAKWSNR